MILEDIKYELDDLTIVPTRISSISSRKQVEIKKNNYYRLFTAPMDTIVDIESYSVYNYAGINAIIPRTIDFPLRLHLLKNHYNIAVSLNEFQSINKNNIEGSGIICIDVANGHMENLIEATRVFSKYNENTNIELMIGNIANSNTIIYLPECVNYVRVGIGGGSQCLTSTKTGIHYPLGSLISECYELKKSSNKPVKIVADGGIYGTDNIIKCYALGADYVMLGKMFGETDAKLSGISTRKDKTKYREMYGMASKEGAKALGKKCNVSEGRSSIVEIDKTLQEFITEYEGTLQSAMSYCGAKAMDEFIGKCDLVAHLKRGFNNL